MEVQLKDQWSPGLDECILASAVKFLVEGGEQDAAQVLLSCRVEVAEGSEDQYGHVQEYIPDDIPVRIMAPRSAYDHLQDSDDPIRESIFGAFRAVLNGRAKFTDFEICAELLSVLDENWRVELAEIAGGREINNQALGAIKPRFWQNLRFRSESEMRVAQALDRAGVLFFPLPKGRITGPSGRANKEPDFIVCQHGKWGILEVDGHPFHPPTRAAEDHERDRLFKRNGVRVVEHFDASECFEVPHKVVSAFLSLLAKS